MSGHDLVSALVVLQVAAPAAALAAIGVPALLGRPLGEHATRRLVGAGFAGSVLAERIATLERRAVLRPEPPPQPPKK